MSLKDVQKKVKTALRLLRELDSFLLEADTNERTISHKLAEYLQKEFPDYNVDCEYNRHGYDIKKLGNLKVPNGNLSWDEPEAKTIFPDIIVHKRNTDENNFLVIEIKKSSNKKGLQFDIEKLVALTAEEYQYRFGLFLIISMNRTFDSLVWYSDGEIIDEEHISI